MSDFTSKLIDWIVFWFPIVFVLGAFGGFIVWFVSDIRKSRREGRKIIQLQANPQSCSAVLRQKLDDGKKLDDALADLRASGATIVQCIIAVTLYQGCGPDEAKRLVHSSPAWADVSEKMRHSDCKFSLVVAIVCLVVALSLVFVPRYRIMAAVFAFGAIKWFVQYRGLSRQFSGAKDSREHLSS
jgi:hypothetical protein